MSGQSETLGMNEMGWVGGQTVISLYKSFVIDEKCHRLFSVFLREIVCFPLNVGQPYDVL